MNKFKDLHAKKGEGGFPASALMSSNNPYAQPTPTNSGNPYQQQQGQPYGKPSPMPLGSNTSLPYGITPGVGQPYPNGNQGFPSNHQYTGQFVDTPSASNPFPQASSYSPAMTPGYQAPINPYPASVAAPLAPNIFPVSSSIPGYPAPLANGTYPNVTTGYQPPSSSVYPPLSSGYPPSGTNYPDGPSYLPQSGYPNAAPYPGAGPNQTGVAPGSAGGWAM